MILLWFILLKHWFINDSVNKEDAMKTSLKFSIISFFASEYELSLFTWKIKKKAEGVGKNNFSSQGVGRGGMRKIKWKKEKINKS